MKIQNETKTDGYNDNNNTKTIFNDIFKEHINITSNKAMLKQELKAM